ncbi:NAC domain-containing protein 105-like [Lycium barbarum]|uniref:NAC domain-containing protein 105-like n=1 Tax=Lycium barbarum TaxID=112863 RepID=UPI00293E1472|nr:NAC domain-containing protein 105-like [Lycium barbarum]
MIFSCLLLIFFFAFCNISDSFRIWTIIYSICKIKMENQGIPQPPPGVRFNPTEEELVGYYLKKWVNSEPDDGFIFIPDIEPGLEPWDIKDKAKILGYEEQEDWYYFVLNNRKYKTGTKMHRATKAGYWKASGLDKAVFSKNGEQIGTKRSLAFYEGRAPKGKRTNWTAYEYRLLTSQHGPPDQPQAYQEWVICKGFIKKSPPNNKSRLESSNNDLPIEAIPSNPSSTTHHNDPPNPIFSQTSSFNPFTFNPTMNTSHHDQNYMSQVPEGNPTMYTSHHDQNYMSQVPEGNPTMYTSHHDQNYMSQVPEGNPTMYTSHHDQNYMSQPNYVYFSP